MAFNESRLHMNSNESPLFKLIDNVSFFDDFSEPEKHELIEKQSLIKKYDKKGSIIFSEGQKGDSVIIILAGEVDIIKSSATATKNIIIAKLGVGSVIGEVSLLSDRSRSTGVATSSNMVVLLEIKRKNLESFDTSLQAKFQQQFVSILIDRLEDMNKKYGKLQSQLNQLKSQLK